MKSINIKGKNYVMVNERIKFFRENYKGWSLTSELVTLNEDMCVIKGIVLDENGVVKATGYAQEDRLSSQINKTSYVENCETSAWGRALGCLGIGIDESIASAEEVDMAIKKQDYQNSIKGGIADDYIMPHGKHTGKALSEISPDYLDWYLANGTSREVKDNINLMRNGLKEVDADKLPWE